MAEIEKALPNEVRKEITIPSEEELQVDIEQPQETKGLLKFKKTKTEVLT